MRIVRRRRRKAATSGSLHVGVQSGNDAASTGNAELGADKRGSFGINLRRPDSEALTGSVVAGAGDDVRVCSGKSIHGCPN
jgi:hypothetical protein